MITPSTLRVFRGGSWFGFAAGCRVAFRCLGDPGYRFNFLGIRCARGRK